MDNEILKEFQAEAKQLVLEIKQVIEKMDDSETLDLDLVEQFAIRIDRIMGAAKTIAMVMPEDKAFSFLGKICETCKFLGYQLIKEKQDHLFPLCQAFWSEVMEVIEKIILWLEHTETTEQIILSQGPTIENRLAWLKGKFLKSA